MIGVRSDNAPVIPHRNKRNISVTVSRALAVCGNTSSQGIVIHFSFRRKHHLGVQTALKVHD
jgi:hypothetical protein